LDKSERLEEEIILETGNKVIDLMAPCSKNMKNGIIGGPGLGKTFLMMQLMKVFQSRLFNNDRKTVFWELIIKLQILVI